MNWPPNNAWTSTSTRVGYRHFEVQKYGGTKQDRWVELSPVVNKKILLKVYWSELKSDKWKTGWLQILEDDDDRVKT